MAYRLSLIAYGLWLMAYGGWRDVTPALRSSKGMGPMFEAVALALLLKLGHISRQEIAKLVGEALLNRDRGQTQGRRNIYGG